MIESLIYNSITTFPFQFYHCIFFYDYQSLLHCCYYIFFETFNPYSHFIIITVLTRYSLRWENMKEKPPLTVRFRVQCENLMIRGNKLPGGFDAVAACPHAARRRQLLIFFSPKYTCIVHVSISFCNPLQPFDDYKKFVIGHDDEIFHVTDYNLFTLCLYISTYIICAHSTLVLLCCFCILYLNLIVGT